MTAAQKTAKANFKKAIEYRKKTGVSLKEAFAHVYGKKVGAVKKKAAPKRKAAVKKAAPKRKAAVKKANRQTETSIKKYDILHQAKPVGVRKTKNPHKYHGKTIRKSTTYTERRANRSDKGVLLGIAGINKISDLEKLVKQKELVLRDIAEKKDNLKTAILKPFYPMYKKAIAHNNKYLKYVNQQITQLKKHI